MKIENKIGQTFENSAQRLVYNYIAIRADFAPVASDNATEQAQREFYDFMSDIYNRLYDDPSIAGLNIEPDETEDRPLERNDGVAWNHLHLAPRKLRRKNNKILTELFGVLQCMGDVGKVANGKLVINKTDLGFTKVKLNKLLKTLPLLGFVINDNGDALIVWSAKHLQMCPAWKLLSTTAGDDIHIFMRTVFNPATDDITEVFYKYSDVEQPLRDFVKVLLAVGFKSQVSYGDVQGDMVGIKYVREHLETGVKTAKQMKDETIRLVFSCMYQFRYHPQISYDFMSGKNPFIYLHKRFKTLPPAVQAVVYKFSGHCDGCGSCIVGDKSKVQTFSFTPVMYKGEDIKLCHTYKNMDTHTGYFRKPVYNPDEEFLSSVLEMYEVFANNLPVV